MIILENVTKKYGEGFAVLNQVNLSFSDSGLYLLSGESGSGKTTLLNILAGLITFEGTIYRDGTSYNEKLHFSLEEEPAYITQDPFFADFLSVLDNLKLLGVSEDECRTVLKRLRIEEKAGQIPSSLSGGEKQRLALSRALLKGARVLLLDEPTASLDDKNKQMVFKVLEDLKNDCLIICSTHDPEMLPYADTVFTLSKKSGQIEECVQNGTEKHSEKRLGGEEKHPNTQKSKATRPRISYILFQWLFSKKRERAASFGFSFFLVLSFLIVSFADIPKHKAMETDKYLLRLNSFSIQLSKNLTWVDVAPDDSEAVREVVLNYSRNIPEPGGGGHDLVYMGQAPDYDTNLLLLPSDPKCFPLKDKIAYGTYYTKPEQVILSHEMAEKLSGGEEENLLGTTIEMNLYQIGKVKLEVVGILKQLNSFELGYLDSLTNAAPLTRVYRSEDYESLFFANAALIDSLENDPTFFSSGRRHYTLYFDSYDQMIAFRRKCENLWKDKLEIGILNSSMAEESEFMTISILLIPLALVMSLMSAMFFAEIKRSEYAYNNRVVAVLEYCGYSKSNIIGGIVRLTVLETMIYLMGSFGLAWIITYFVNLLNRTKWFISLQLFSWNPILVICFVVLILIVSGLYSYIMIASVKTTSWYEQSISSRDIL